MDVAGPDLPLLGIGCDRNQMSLILCFAIGKMAAGQSCPQAIVLRIGGKIV